MENKEQKGIFTRIYEWFKNLTLTGLLRFIIIVIIIIIVLMSVPYLPKLISRASSSLSAALYSIFVPAENATMTADKKIVNSGENFNVTFDKGADTDGIFSLSYDCDANLTLLAIENNGLKNVTCNKPYYILSDSGTITLRAITENENVYRLVLTGALENNETQKIENVGVVRITVKNDASGPVVDDTSVIVATSTSVTPAPTTPYIPSQPAPVYYGKPDLAVRVLQTGLLNQYNNQITSQTRFDESDLVGIKFEIRNDGDANTGIWYFSAILPSTSNPMYNSNAQISLRPGESIIYTLGFSNLSRTGSNLITVRADQNGLVRESNENNNAQTITITSTGSNDNNNDTCYINGWLTYNCDDYYDNDNNNDEVDLAVEILKVGKINSSGNFVEDDTINEGDTAAVRFRVTNEGDEESDRWDYEVRLTPSFTGDEYTKRNMSALDPGESVTVTVEFEDASDTGTNRFRVEIDPNNDLDEDERDNNDATETIEID